MLMKKYLKLLFVALFATMTLSFASCKDDKDEPDGGNNSTSFSNMTLKINGDTYYYGRIMMDMEDIMQSYQMGDVSVEKDGTVFCGIVAVDKDISYNEWMDGYRYGSNSEIFATLEFDLEPFDFKSAKKGQKLTIKDGGGIYWAHTSRINQWEYQTLSSGEVIFISYEETNSEDFLLTLELRDVTLTSPKPNNPNSTATVPESLNFSGTVMLTEDGIYTVIK